MVKPIIIGLVVITVTSYVGVAVYNSSYDQTHTSAVQAPQLPDKQQVFDLVNQERTKVGEAPLIDDVRLDASAEAKCADMVQYNYQAHVSPSGVSWNTFFYPELRTLHDGENIAWDYFDAKTTTEAWMASPTHKQNILDATYNHVGYAVCGPSSNGLFQDAIVQHFAQIN